MVKYIFPILSSLTVCSVAVHPLLVAVLLRNSVDVVPQQCVVDQPRSTAQQSASNSPTYTRTQSLEWYQGL